MGKQSKGDHEVFGAKVLEAVGASPETVFVSHRAHRGSEFSSKSSAPGGIGCRIPPW